MKLKWESELDKNMQKSIIALYLHLYFDFDEDFGKVFRSAFIDISDDAEKEQEYIKFKKQTLEKYPKLKKYIV